MKLSAVLGLLACLAPVFADKYRLCCCADNGQCDIPATQNVVNSRLPIESWVMSSKSWDHDVDKAPYTCTGCYAYSIIRIGYDDGFIGGKEMHKKCVKQKNKPGSRCFNSDHYAN
ncbi:hypothetical protein EG328_011916 [Venturia inaequalis]|uniref:Uncharacterized protein n=1 Tax=Venturia inaequalis TaxID=5025 RepID=A0A8H3YJQ6_VENIN|nr:hypothetical protein EG328_011916 [Venturia inaequalis]KAE9967923.1 hypothetical protein EG327_011250 [Venturia inaequalis]RDI83879.1 hypothetical protein Vi05172_g6391 [Venturia inaequalis]